MADPQTTTTSGATSLTLDSILEAWANVPQRQRLRIVVGMPFVRPGDILKWESRQIILCGDEAFRAVKRLAAESSPDSYMMDLCVGSILGVPIEYYGDRPDHRDLLRAALHEIGFGSTKEPTDG